MSDDAFLEEGRERAEALLLANGCELGLLGATRHYQQVWARDSMVGGLALMLLRDRAAGLAIHERSLATLARHQTRLGNLPHNVGIAGVADPALVEEGGRLRAPSRAPPGAEVADNAHAGCIDSALWFIIGHDVAHALDPDGTAAGARLRAAWPSLERAYTWLDYQDSNECGLLEAHEAMDWADLFSNRYNTLFANVLWFGAHRAMARMARSLGEEERARASDAAADDVRFKLDTLLWVGPESARDAAWIEANRREWVYPVKLTDIVLQDRPFYLPYMAFRSYSDRFDAFGNVLAVLLGVADEAKTARILDYVRGAALADPWPIRVLYPPIQPGEADWREYFRLRNLNLPGHYHNGGTWPMVGGFYVAALVRARRLDEAKDALLRLGRACSLARFGGVWEFNEWHHGETGRPMGFPGQSWSAAMYLYAYECVKRGFCPGFEEEPCSG